MFGNTYYKISNIEKNIKISNNKLLNDVVIPESQSVCLLDKNDDNKGKYIILYLNLIIIFDC
jgi:hypothetical protein